MQLIYRWTKSLDPSLRRGYWAPEEDAVGVWALGCGRRARRPHCKRTESGVGGSVTVWSVCPFLQKLLQAVAKYGERDWFKIRAEVPGRSDAQCRDR